MRSASRISVLSFGWVKGRRKLILGVLLPALILAGASCFQALAQQPTSDAPIYQVNSQYLQGRTWADYQVTKGTGLNVHVANGTVWCKTTLVTYAGGTLSLTNGATNYVYLDTAASCAPAHGTDGFPPSAIPLATAVTAGGAITSLTDNRSLLTTSAATATSGREYNLKDYGAVCDGSTDDSSALQAAINAVGTKGGVIYVPPSATKCVIGSAVTLPVNGVGRRNYGVGAIRFLLDGGLKITRKIDWLDSQVTIQGRAGGAHPWGGSSSNAEIECALDAATSCIENTKDAVYGLNFENLTFSGVVKNYLDLGDIDGCHLTNLVTSPDVARESVVLRGGIWVWIKDGALFGNGPTYGAIGLYGRGTDNWLPNEIYIDGTILAHGGIHAYSDDQLAGGGVITQVVINNVVSEDLSDEFFVASGTKAMSIEGISFDHVNMADPLVNAALLKFTGGASATNINVQSSCDSASPHQIVATGSNSVLGLNIYGSCAGIYPIPGPNNGFSMLLRDQPQMSSLFLGKFNALTYHPPILQVEPDGNDRETLVIRPYNDPTYHYPDTFRLEDPDTLQNYFTLDALGKQSSAEIGGSIKLNQLGTPGGPTVTPTGADDGKTWGYKVVALDRLGGHTAASTEGTNAHGAATLGVDDYNTVNWNCVSQAYQIQIWRTTVPGGGSPATTGLIATIPGSIPGTSANGVCHYPDHGDAGDGNPEPSTNTTGVLQAPIITGVTGFRVNGGAASGVGSCTNQFVTATNSDAAPTCSTATLASAQFANQGTTTTVLHGNAAGNPAFGAVVVADVTAVLRTRQFGYIAGSDTATAVLADTDDQTTIYVNRLGQGITITEVFCECDAGTPRIQLARDDGTPANILTDNAGAGMDCAAAGATGTLDANEKLIGNGDRVDFIMVTAGGVAKRVTVYVKYTLD
jgi:hypothetical protein